jgi:hypothetical protein
MATTAIPTYTSIPGTTAATAADAGGRSAVSWAAIIGGAVASAALTLVLLALVAGIGLTTVSPWSNSGATMTGFGIGAAIWFIVVQWLASGVGGYLTGRLRTRWVSVHTDEVFFRDTANGFLSWALATVVGAGFLASAIAATAGGITHTAATVASGAEQGAAQIAAGQRTDPSGGPMGYFVDSLFRPAASPAGRTPAQAPAQAPGSSASPAPSASAPDAAPDANAVPAPGSTPAATNNAAAPRGEIVRIFATDLQNGDMPAGDRTYLAQLVAARTGISQADAEKRVDDTMTRLKTADAKARQAVDVARKATATFSIMIALSLAIGAFIASAAAALGGHERDAW